MTPQPTAHTVAAALDTAVAALDTTAQAVGQQRDALLLLAASSDGATAEQCAALAERAKGAARHMLLAAGLLDGIAADVEQVLGPAVSE